MARRRVSDHFTKRAREQGYAARSVFKLQEIDSKHRLFRTGQRVLDLGCAPGSWLKLIAKRVGPKGCAVGIDRTEVSPMAGHVKTIAGDIFETEAHVFFESAGGHFDVITSDMAPDTCGNRFVDHVRSVELCTRALILTDTLLVEGGAFVCKVFDGQDVNQLVDDMRSRFKSVKRVKPKSTRSESVEFFLVGIDKKEPPVDSKSEQETNG
ncbi:MAG: RlmE family RNA methyltransferase [Myxococcota bacterium]|nr:RlmE family RNA methyltransferase [Myxococcota bacterium]